MTARDALKVALAQIAPAWLNRAATLQSVVEAIENAAGQGAQLVVFGEGLVPGYPFWLTHTGGAEFESPAQKAWYAHYQREAVDIEAGDLQPICDAARRHRIAVYLGVIEKCSRRSMSVFASLMYIDAAGEIGSAHRKLQPTYEERLVWAQGDGHGLRTHPLGAWTVGGLNCWENWMPLPRAALYAQGETLHVAVWPGSERNTNDITRFIARESRSYVVSVSGLMDAESLGSGGAGNLPEFQRVLDATADNPLANGGSCVAAPDGSWVLAPVTDEAGIFVVELDLQRVREERQNFDPAGHYSRPDVTHLQVDRRRSSITGFDDD